MQVFASGQSATESTCYKHVGVHVHVCVLRAHSDYLYVRRVVGVTEIRGPEDSPYEAGLFNLEVAIPTRSLSGILFQSPSIYVRRVWVNPSCAWVVSCPGTRWSHRKYVS